MFENRAHWADKAFWWVAPIVILASAGGGAYYYFHTRQKQPQPTVKVTPPAPVAGRENAAVQHPVPGAASDSQDAEPLPALNDSDLPMRAALEETFGGAPVKQMLAPEGIVRRIVVTIDNLPRQKVAVEKRPLKAVAGQTAVAMQGDLITLSEENYARYAPFMRLLRSADSQQLANLYFRFYPLFQQAYEDLGYPGQYFNDRLVDVIDNLLATPDVTGPIALVQPRVFYEFADPKLEARPAGQKLLLRIGPENAAIVKAKLRELRQAVTSGRQILPEPAEAPTGSGIVSPHGGMHHWL